MDTIQHKQLTKYLADRDALRAKKHNYDIPLTAKLWSIATSPVMRCMKGPLIFDNTAILVISPKKINYLSAFVITSECPFCTTSDSASHWSVQCVALPHTVATRATVITHIQEMLTLDQESKTALRHLGRRQEIS